MSNELENYNTMYGGSEREIIKSPEHTINTDATVSKSGYNFEEIAEYVGLIPIEFFELCSDNIYYFTLSDEEILNLYLTLDEVKALHEYGVLPAKECENRINLIIESDAKSNLML